MRVVIALGGNALIQRGQAMSADVQRTNIRTAASRPGAGRQGPPADRVARQRPAGRPAGAAGGGLSGRRALSTRHPGRRNAGHDRLPAGAGAWQRAALRGAAGHHPVHGRGGPRRPGLRRPDQVRGTGVRRGHRQGPGRREGLDRQAGRRVLAAGRAFPAPPAHLRAATDEVAARAGRADHLRGRRRDPDHVRPRREPPAGRRRGSRRQGPCRQPAGSRPGGRPVRDGHRCRRRVHGLGDAQPASFGPASPRPSWRAAASRRGPWVPRWRPRSSS